MYTLSLLLFGVTCIALCVRHMFFELKQNVPTHKAAFSVLSSLLCPTM